MRTGPLQSGLSWAVEAVEAGGGEEEDEEKMFFFSFSEASSPEASDKEEGKKNIFLSVFGFLYPVVHVVIFVDHYCGSTRS